MVIGIDRYAAGIPALRTAVNDARRLGELLAAEHGYAVTALLDADASQARITQLLTQELPAQVQPDDRVLFYFAGHGVARDGDEGPNGYLLPADAQRGDEGTYLHMPLVHDALMALPCRHMLVVLDSCFSGAFRWSGTRDIMEDFEVVHQEKYDRFVRDPAWQVITSASQDQKAIDQLSAGALGARDVVGDHSPFANALFEAISGKGDLIPRGTGDGLVTATELYLFLEESLQHAAASVGTTQTPRLWPLKKHDKGEFVFFVPGRDMVLPPAPELTFERNPWLGLASYDAGNAVLFFGRDAEIATLRERITAQPLTVVLGASGTGKSSLVKAGAVPRLQADGWHVLPVMRPGSTPLAALAQALTEAGSAPITATPAAITARVEALVTAHAPVPVLLVIDQFEELITLARDSTERDAVLALLAQLVEAHSRTFRLVVTIRTDFEPNFDRTAFGDRWTAGRFIIPPMSRENMRAVIEKPAAARVLYFEPSNLVETLLDEVVATPGALPLLSFALSEMYIAFVKRQGGDRAITRANYDALGGVAGALRSRAEAEYAALDDAHRATLRRVMLRLVSSDGAGLARRRVSDDELTFADAAEQARAKIVVDRLTTARLLVEGREADGATFVEPAHDALVRGWGRLLGWVRDEGSARFPLLQQQRLARAAEEWERTGDASRDGMLWRDAARSAQLAPLVRQRAAWFNARELAFARRSIRGRNIARATAAAAALIIVVAGAVAAIAGLRASRRAEEVRIASVARTAQSLVSEDPLLAALLLGSIDSAMVARLDEATRLSLLGTALQLGRGPQVSMTFGSRPPLDMAVMSRDGRWLVDVEEGKVWLHQLGSGLSRRLPSDTIGGTTSVAFDRAGSQVALGGDLGIVHVVALDDARARPLVFSASNMPLTHVEFSRSGSLLLVTNGAGTLRVVDLEAARRAGVRAPVRGDTTIIDERLVRWRAEGVQFAVALDGERVATVSGDGTALQFWSANGVKERAYALSRSEEIAVVSVSPDGRSVAIGSDSGALDVVSLGQRAQRFTLGQHAGPVVALAWSPDGSHLVSTGVDNTVRLWNTTTHTLQRSLTRPDEPMQTVTFSGDGRRFVTSSPYTYHAVLFDTTGTAITLPGHTNEILTAGVAEDGRIVTAARDGGIWLWTPPPAPLHQTVGGIDPAHPSGGDITAVGFTRDSRAVALASRDGLLYRYRLDSAATAVPLDTLPGTLRALHWSDDGEGLHALRYDGGRLRWSFGATSMRSEVENPLKELLVDAQQSLDGRYVLALTTDGDATVWDIADSTPPVRVTMVPAESICRDPQDEKYEENNFSCDERRPQCAAMSGNGEWLATCRTDGSIVVQRRDGRTPPRYITVPSDQAKAVALSANGSVLAASFGQGVVRTWPTDVPADSGRRDKISEINVTRLVFAPDGQRLAALTSDNWVHVLDRTTGVARPVLRPRGQALQLLRFTPDGRHLLTVGQGEKEARLWTVDGAGSAVSLHAGDGLIAELAVSPDGRWIVTTNDRQGAQLHPLDVNLALTPFRASAICLSEARRQRYLLESSGTARTRYEECNRRQRPADELASH